MPYANNQEVHIHYEIEGEGPPLVLLHGLGGSLEHWRQTGYVEALKNEYRVILIDARGHGASDKPHEPKAYRMTLRVADVLAVLDDLNIAKAHYLGYSMGGRIGWGIAKYAPHRFHSLIIGGSSPYGNPPEGLSFIELFQKGLEATLAAMEPIFGRRWTAEEKALCAANDLKAMIALLSVDERLDIEKLLPTVTVPCLLFGGEEDPWYAGAEKCSRRMPNATFVSLPGLDHIEGIYRIDLVLPHVIKFMAEVSQVG